MNIFGKPKADFGFFREISRAAARDQPTQLERVRGIAPEPDIVALTRLRFCGKMEPNKKESL